MTTDTAKPIPAAYLRSQEFARQKQAKRQREYERRQRRAERVAQRLAAALGENTQEAFMDETHPGRIYFRESQVEKFYQLVDASRAGLAGQLALWSWVKAAMPNLETVDDYHVGYEGILHPYIEPNVKDSPEALAQKQAKLQQELNEVTAKLKAVTLDELKSKMLTLMDVGEAVTVSKPDPNAPTGPQLVKDEAPVEAASTAGG